MEACFELKGEKHLPDLAYYDENYHFWIWFLIISRCFVIGGQVSRTESKLPQANQCGKMWLRLRNDANVLSAWYSADGKKWHKYPWGFEISGVHHNTVYGFLFVRPGIFAGGDGQGEVTDFVLRNLD